MPLREMDLKEKIRIYKNLPSELRDALFSSETDSALGKISQKYSLEKQQISVLSLAIGYVLMGLLKPDEFISALEENLKTERSLATDIARDVTREIFFPVRDSLIKLYGLEEVIVSGAKTPTISEQLKEEKPPEISAVKPKMETPKKEELDLREPKPLIPDWAKDMHKEIGAGPAETKKEPGRKIPKFAEEDSYREPVTEEELKPKGWITKSKEEIPSMPKEVPVPHLDLGE